MSEQKQWDANRLHNEIMNIRCDPVPAFPFASGAIGPEQLRAYKEGHRDARHAAAELALLAAPPAQPARQLVSVSSIDIERMIAECLPGGHSCDPQQVADAIRQYCNAAQPAQAQPARLSDERIDKIADSLWEAGHISCLSLDTGRIFAHAIAAAVVPPGFVVVQDWQPIETAPKDELILVGPTKRMGICVAMHHSRDGWVTETTSEWVTMYAPTHWMPLPSAPKATK